MTVLGLAWRNLVRNKMRAALMMIAVTVAFTLYGALFGFAGLLDGQHGVAGSRDLIVHHRVNIIQTLPAHYRSEIAQTPGVANVSEVALMGGYVGEPSNKVPTLMTSAEAFLAQNRAGIVLTAAERAAFLATRDGIIVDRHTASANGWKVGDEVTVTSEIQLRTDGSSEWPFRLVGIYGARTAGDAVTGGIGHVEYLNGAAAFGKDRVHWFAVQTRDAALNDRVAAALDAAFSNSEAQTKTEPAAAMARAFLSQVVDFTLVIRIVVASAFATILMVVGNTMALVVRQRRREIGVFRALGFPSRRVGAIILSESLLIAAIGAIAGLALSSVLLALMAAGMTGGTPSLDTLSLDVVGSGLALAMAFGILTGLFPTLSAVRIRPAEAFTRS